MDRDRVPAFADADPLSAEPSPVPVGICPAGESPEGVADLMGNVWQWTDEYVDEHTRAAILRGGSHYRPVGSIWKKWSMNDNHVAPAASAASPTRASSPEIAVGPPSMSKMVT